MSDERLRERVRRAREKIGLSAVENMDVFDEEIVEALYEAAGPAAELARLLAAKGVPAQGRVNLLVGMAIALGMHEDDAG